MASERHRLWSARDSYLGALAVAESTANRSGECLSRNALAKVSIRLGLLGEAAEHLDQSRRLAREIGHAGHTSDALGVGALLASRKGDWVIARVDAERALQIAVDIGEPWLRSQALDVLGGAFEVGSEFQRAEAAYDEAAAVRREHGSVNAAVESVGGLARVALATGNHETAMRHVEDILAHLETGTLEGTIDPVGVYLSCHDVLAAAEDPRADEVLDQGRAFLHDLVESIPDGEMRRAFYENVPSHAAITRR